MIIRIDDLSRVRTAYELLEEYDMQKGILTDHIIKPIASVEKWFLGLVNFEKLFQNVVDFLGLGQKPGRVQKIIEDFLTIDKMNIIDEFIKYEIEVPGVVLETGAVRAHIVGTMLRDKPDRKIVKWDDLPVNIKVAARENSLSDAEISAIRYNISNAALGMKNINNAASSQVIEAVVNGKLNRWSAGRLQQELKSKITDTDENLNRDWRRVAITTANAGTQNGLLATFRAGQRVRIRSHPDACDWCLKNLNGKTFLVRMTSPGDYASLPPDSEEYKRIAKIWETSVWPGKTNIGRRESLMKRGEGGLLQRQHHELLMAALPAHPNCRCFFEEMSELEMM